jgi:hypothetical protein
MRERMNFAFLGFLASPEFVVPWYAFGAAEAAWVVYDVFTANRDVNAALKAGWPVILVFFSILGLFLYLLSCRPPGIGRKSGKEAERLHHEYVSATWKRVTGSVIHCVGGDGLGIISAMVATRAMGLCSGRSSGLNMPRGLPSGGSYSSTSP